MLGWRSVWGRVYKVACSRQTMEPEPAPETGDEEVEADQVEPEPDVDYGAGFPDEVLCAVLCACGWRSTSADLARCALVHPVWWKVARRTPGYVLQTLDGGSEGLRWFALTYDQETKTLFSGSDDGSIKVWRM